MKRSTKVKRKRPLSKSFNRNVENALKYIVIFVFILFVIPILFSWDVDCDLCIFLARIFQVEDSASMSNYAGSIRLLGVLMPIVALIFAAHVIRTTSDIQKQNVITLHWLIGIFLIVIWAALLIVEMDVNNIGWYTRAYLNTFIGCFFFSAVIYGGLMMGLSWFGCCIKGYYFSKT